MNKFLLLLLTLFLAVPMARSQKEDVEKLFDDAEFFLATEEYKEAAYLFQKLVGMESDNANYNFLAGMSYLNVKGEEQRSIPYLEKAVQNTTLKYRERNIGEKQAPYHSWFYLGNAYRINNQLDEALESYAKFKDLREFEKKYNIRIVENEIKAVERAKIIKDSPLNLLKEKLPSSINDGSVVFRPVVNLNESSMVYMKSLKFYDAIMYTFMTDGQWAEPVNITPQVGSDGDMIPSALSADGTEMLLVKRSRSDNGDIYYSKLNGKSWTEAVKMNKNINSSRNEAHASFSYDGRYLYLSSSRRGGFGGLDLYVSKKDADGNWGEPENLGPNINSPEDENAVYVVDKGNTIYFTSKGHFNMGGYDIFYANLMSDGEWGEAKNLGYPVNTTNDNEFYQPVNSEKSGYLALFDNDFETTSSEEIFRIEILPANEPATFSKSLFNRSFSLILNKEESTEKITVTYDVKTDSFTVISPGGSSYDIKLMRKGN